MKEVRFRCRHSNRRCFHLSSTSSLLPSSSWCGGVCGWRWWRRWWRVVLLYAVVMGRWGEEGALAENGVPDTLLIRPPQIMGNTSYTEGDTLVLTCEVTSGNLSVLAVNFYCTGHTNRVDSSFTPGVQTQVNSTIEIQPVTVSLNGTRCFCVAHWVPQPSLVRSSTPVTITVQAKPDTGNNPDDDEDDEVQLATLVGGVVGGVAAVIIIALIIVIIFLLKRDVTLCTPGQPQEGRTMTTPTLSLTTTNRSAFK